VIKEPQKRRPRSDLGCGAIGRKKEGKNRPDDDTIVPKNITVYFLNATL
jgi:hypothetical protein